MMSGNGMMEALMARGPHPNIAESANAIFSPFIGAWDVEIFDLEGDGARRVSHGEWHFGWILEGRAVQDVLLVPPRGERRNGMLVRGNRCATSLRIFDSGSGMWRVHYFNPVDLGEETMIAGMENGQIVQTGTNRAGVSLRHTFDVAQSTFALYRDVSKNGEWRRESEYFARRI